MNYASFIEICQSYEGNQWRSSRGQMRWNIELEQRAVDLGGLLQNHASKLLFSHWILKALHSINETFWSICNDVLQFPYINMMVVVQGDVSEGRQVATTEQCLNDSVPFRYKFPDRLGRWSWKNGGKQPRPIRCGRFWTRNGSETLLGFPDSAERSALTTPACQPSEERTRFQ